jgi:hypothetical protein
MAFNNQIKPIFRTIALWTYKWYLKGYCRGHNVELVHNWFDLVETWLRTRGNLNTIQRLKSLRVIILNYLASTPVKGSPDPSIGLTWDKLPKCLGGLLPLVRSKDPKALRLVMTMLNVSRCIPGHSDPDFSSIVSSASFTESNLLKVWSEIELTIDKMEISLPRPRWSSPHLSTKSGPNGIAMTSSIRDLSLLPPHIWESICEIGGDDLSNYMSLLSNLDPDDVKKLGFNEKNNNLIRKLSLIHDPEAKTRVIAILDYWSQTALKPLHDSLLDLVREKFKGDCTFNQGRFQSLLPKGRWYYSCDLKSCTDRLPVELQERILGKIIDKEYAKH